MATRTWNSGASTDMNATGNYTGSGSFATDDLVFDNTSVVNAAATGAITCNSITIASTYTGTWSLSGQSATCAQGFSDDGTTGAHDYGNAITCNGASATFHVGSGVGTLTTSSLVVTMNGTTGAVIDFDKFFQAKTLVLGVSAIVTNSGASETYYNHTSTILTLGASATLTLTRQIRLICSAAMTPMSLGAGYTINGNGILFIQTSTTGTITIPEFTRSSGTGGLQLSQNSNTGNFSMGGNINVGGGGIDVLTSSATIAVNFTTNNYSVTCGVLSWGASTTGIFTANCGSSVFSISSYSGSTYNNNGTINFQTSQWTCTGSWTFGSNHTVDPGTSLITFSGTAAHTITSNGKLFYDVTINNTATAGTTFADATSLHTLTVSATNTQPVSWVGFVLTASGNITIDGSGTLSCGNGITANGASSNVHFGSTLGTVTASSCVLTMNTSTAGVIDLDKAHNLLQVVLGPSAVVTNSGATTLGILGTSNLLTLGAGASLTITTAINFNLSGSSAFMVLGSGATFSGAGTLTFSSFTTGTGSIPAFTHAGSANIINSTNNATINLAGNISISGTLTFGNNQASSTWTLNFVSYNVSCGIMQGIGSNQATSTCNINFGSGGFLCTSFNSNYNLGTSNISFGTSIFACSGSWTFGSNHTITASAGQSITLTNTATITSNGKVFPGALILNGAGKTFTLADALSVAGNLTITSGTLAGAFTTTCAGDVTVSVSTTFNRLILTKPTTRTVTIGAGTTLTLTNLTNTNVNGSAGALTQWRSSIPGTTYNMSIPAPITLQYQNPRDNVASALVTADDYTSTDGGHNTNWKFPPVGSSGYYAYW